MTITAETLLGGNYVADPIHSTFGFAVRFQGVSVFRGTLAEGSGTLNDGRLEGVAQVESISIRSPQQFREYVLGTEFFDAQSHPEVRFSSSRLDLREDGTATVDGELTIKGITRVVQATGAWTAPEADAFGASRGHLHLETVVDRTEFDMMWEVRLPSGDKALANDVTLTIDLSLTSEG